MNNEMTIDTNDSAPTTASSAQIAASPAYQKTEVTTMKTTNSYPFLSKKQIADRLESDAAFVLECLQIIQARQTEHEKATLTTKDRNHRGWMSSHAVNGGKLAVKAATEGLNSEEFAKAASMVSHYTKQLASHFRAEKIATNPDLAKAAAVFGV